ncbi:hypothetical protein KPL74_01740 [Bacillus sp. NP157]|nr:hypothetical protein KPL74_01740 [Bacillus sp. NP157]
MSKLLTVAVDEFVEALHHGQTKSAYEVVEQHASRGVTVKVQHTVLLDIGAAARLEGLFYLADDLDPDVACLAYTGTGAPKWELLVVKNRPLRLDGMGPDATELLGTALIDRHLPEHLRFDGESLVHYVRKELLDAALPETQTGAGTARRL